MKSIVIDIGLITTSRRGMGIFILNIIKNFQNQSLNKDVILVYNRNNDLKEIYNLKSILKDNKKIRFLYSPFGPILTEQLFLPLLLLNNKNYLLLCNGDSAPIAAKSSRLILLLHDLYFFHGREVYKKSIIPMRKIIGIAYRRVCIGRFRGSKKMRVITVSSTLKKQIFEYGFSKLEDVVIISNGIDFLKITEKVKNVKKNQLVLVTGPDPQKNFKNLYTALLAIRPNIIRKLKRVVVVGMMKPEYCNAIDLKIDFLGFQEHDRIIEILGESKYFVIPSLYESFGIPAIEALTAKCLIASSNTGALPEILEDKALYFNPYDIQSITITLESLLTKDTITTEYDENHIKKFDWKYICEKSFIPYLNSL